LTAGSLGDVGKALGHIDELLRELLKIRYRASNLPFVPFPTIRPAKLFPRGWTFTSPCGCPRGERDL
jgi:hypothetical protein